MRTKGALHSTEFKPSLVASVPKKSIKSSKTLRKFVDVGGYAGSNDNNQEEEEEEDVDGEQRRALSL